MVCRQLGLAVTGEVVRSGRYGPGNGRILLDNVECSGSENNVEMCTNLGWGVHNCVHLEDVGVRCGEIGR